jgi:two-component system chemotaxis response regulator CheY
MRALVADDSGVMRKIVARSLRAVGIDDILEAADGNEAAEAFQANSPDLLLIDWDMPGMSGLELVRAVRLTARPCPLGDSSRGERLCCQAVRVPLLES